MLYRDFEKVAESIINQKMEIQRRRAAVMVQQGKLAKIEDYNDFEDEGYLESVAPLDATLKVLRDTFFQQN